MKGDFFCEHIGEIIERSEYSVGHTSFLTPREQKIIFDSFPKARTRMLFFGGAYGLERRIAFFIPEWLIELKRSGDSSLPSDAVMASPDLFGGEREKFAGCLYDDEDFSSVIHPLRIDTSGFASLSHRDFLGAIINLGIERETVGDIVISGNSATVFALPGSASLILAELTKIARDGVRVRELTPAEGISVQSERRFEEKISVIASLRLDCVVKECASVSRDEAQRLIRTGFVELNYFRSEDVSAVVSAGDILSVRGYGKFIFASVEGETRRERIRVKIRKFV